MVARSSLAYKELWFLALGSWGRQELSVQLRDRSSPHELYEPLFIFYLLSVFDVCTSILVGIRRSP